MQTIFLRRLLLVIVVCSSFLTSTFGQNSTLSGKVLDDKGAPVAKASVNALGANVGVTTNEEGVFSISLPSTVKALVISDRKSTRLNSSHSQISYAVFCLKKKKKK